MWFVKSGDDLSTKSISLFAHAKVLEIRSLTALVTLHESDWEIALNQDLKNNDDGEKQCHMGWSSEKMHSTTFNVRRFRSSCPCAKYHPGICSLVILFC